MSLTVIFVNTRPTRSEAEPPFWAAAGLGLRVVIIGDAPPPVPSSLYYEFAQADTYNFEQLRAVAREVSSRHEVAGVVCWGDRDVEGVAHVAAELGLPGNSVEAARRARNKHLSRQSLSQHGKTLIPKFASVRSLDELEEELPQFPLPAVLKPAGASSSKGIFTVHTLEEARAAAGKLLHYTTAEIDPIFRYYPGELLLEQFLEGTEHSVEGIVVGGKLLTAVVTDKFVDRAFSIETQQIQPSGLQVETQRACVAAAQTVATALELGTTAIHLELKVDGDSIRVIELNSRTGGGYITTHLLPLSRGYDFLRNVLIAHCGLGEVRPIPVAHLHAGSRQHLAKGTGRFTALRGIDSAMNTPGVVSVFMDLAPCKHVAQPPSDFTSAVVASVVAVAGSRENLEAILLDAEGKLEEVLE